MTIVTSVSHILADIEQGDPGATEKLLPLVYDELRRLAAQRLSHEKPGQTLQPTALVHEAYLRLVGGSTPAEWNSRGHFFAAAAEAMRRILIEQARRKQSIKRGGSRERGQVPDLAQEPPADPLDLLALDEALERLERLNSRQAELIKLRYFAGLTIEQAAAVLGIAPSTANEDWVYAKSWLRLEMRPAD